MENSTIPNFVMMLYARDVNMILQKSQTGNCQIIDKVSKNMRKHSVSAFWILTVYKYFVLWTHFRQNQKRQTMNILP